MADPAGRWSAPVSGARAKQEQRQEEKRRRKEEARLAAAAEREACSLPVGAESRFSAMQHLASLRGVPTGGALAPEQRRFAHQQDDDDEAPQQEQHHNRTTTPAGSRLSRRQREELKEAERQRKADMEDKNARRTAARQRAQAAADPRTWPTLYERLRECSDELVAQLDALHEEYESSPALRVQYALGVAGQVLGDRVQGTMCAHSGQIEDDEDENDVWSSPETFDAVDALLAHGRETPLRSVLIALDAANFFSIHNWNINNNAAAATPSIVARFAAEAVLRGGVKSATTSVGQLADVLEFFKPKLTNSQHQQQQQLGLAQFNFVASTLVSEVETDPQAKDGQWYAASLVAASVRVLNAAGGLVDSSPAVRQALYSLADFVDTKLANFGGPIACQAVHSQLMTPADAPAALLLDAAASGDDQLAQATTRFLLITGIRHHANFVKSALPALFNGVFKRLRQRSQGQTKQQRTATRENVIDFFANVFASSFCDNSLPQHPTGQQMLSVVALEEEMVEIIGHCRAHGIEATLVDELIALARAKGKDRLLAVLQSTPKREFSASQRRTMSPTGATLKNKSGGAAAGASVAGGGAAAGSSSSSSQAAASSSSSNNSAKNTGSRPFQPPLQRPPIKPDADGSSGWFIVFVLLFGLATGLWVISLVLRADPKFYAFLESYGIPVGPLKMLKSTVDGMFAAKKNKGN